MAAESFKIPIGEMGSGFGLHKGSENGPTVSGESPVGTARRSARSLSRKGMGDSLPRPTHSCGAVRASPSMNLRSFMEPNPNPLHRSLVQDFGTLSGQTIPYAGNTRYIPLRQLAPGRPAAGPCPAAPLPRSTAAPQHRSTMPASPPSQWSRTTVQRTRRTAV